MTILTHSEPTARPFIDTWTAEKAVVLQRAFRMTNDAFGAHLDIAPRTVAEWHARPTLVPRNHIQRTLDDAYEGARQAVVERFAQLLQPKGEAAPVAPQASVPPQPPALDPVVAQMAADMALMQARIDSLQEKLGALALRVLT